MLLMVIELLQRIILCTDCSSNTWLLMLTMVPMLMRMLVLVPGRVMVCPIIICRDPPPPQKIVKTGGPQDIKHTVYPHQRLAIQIQ